MDPLSFIHTHLWTAMAAKRKRNKSALSLLFTHDCSPFSHSQQTGKRRDVHADKVEGDQREEKEPREKQVEAVNEREGTGEGTNHQIPEE